MKMFGGEGTESPSGVSRRDVLRTGLVLAFYVPALGPKFLTQAMAQEQQGAQAAPPAAPPANAFVRIAPDDTVTITISKLEMGQGVFTSLAQLIAEELDCDWAKVQCVSAPVDAAYDHPMMHTMITGGSMSVNSSWEQHRKVGAAMKEMLVSAAATKWGVPAKECKAAAGVITHAKKDKLRYGEVAEAAAQMPVPTAPTLKKAKDFKIIGKSVPRKDAEGKSRGTAQFGLDVKLPGMVYAVIARPPVPGSPLVSLDSTEAKAVKGVVDVVQFEGRVAVLAKNTHAAIKGRSLLKLTWGPSEHDGLSSDGLAATFKAKADEPGAQADNRGDVTAKLAAAKEKIVADYSLPFLAHAPMEPMNCTITFDGTKCEMWSGHQVPTIDRAAAAKVLGLEPAAVMVHTTFAGGSFGRRASKHSDYVVEAAQLVKELKKPVKVVWTREDDMRGGYYRPMSHHRVTLGHDGKQLQGWDHRIVAQSIMKGTFFEKMMIKDGVEGTAVEGVAGTHYALPDFRCGLTMPDTPYNTLWWRSVGHTHTAFVMETMIDELATATKQDPVAMRKAMLKSSPRHVAVLDLLAKRSGYPKKKPAKGRAYGLAIHESFGSVVGQVAEVSVDDKGMPRVHKVWSVAHIGQVVHPEVAKTQVESSIAFGLSAMYYQEVKIDKGQVVSANFDDYQVLRLGDMPEVDVAFVPSDEVPTGLGEPGLPPIAPAVANAMFKLTGKRVRTLPLVKAPVA